VSTEGELAPVRESRDAMKNAVSHSTWQEDVEHPRHPLGHLVHEHNHDALVTALNRLFVDLRGLEILDVGCGTGSWLRYLVDLGADPQQLAGIDPCEQQIEAARAANPAICWIHDDTRDVPFPPNCFDIVLQCQTFSAIVDEKRRVALAEEIWRVVRPGGLIFWIDHKRDGSETSAGFSKQAVLEYFPNGEVVYARSVHPRYFQKMYRRGAGLAQAIYRLMRLGCDSWFLAIEVEK
jgi:ubiquinone/menaquinone biosynthesis C-methylase UbiE